VACVRCFAFFFLFLQNVNRHNYILPLVADCICIVSLTTENEHWVICEIKLSWHFLILYGILSLTLLVSCFCGSSPVAGRPSTPKKYPSNDRLSCQMWLAYQRPSSWMWMWSPQSCGHYDAIQGEIHVATKKMKMPRAKGIQGGHSVPKLVREHDTIRWAILTCSQKLTGNQRSLPHL